VYNDEQRVVAALGVSGPLVQVDLDRIDALGKLVKNYAGQIAERLGYRRDNNHQPV
jgi:DNA-binding IclR family transcriptional regulator